MKIRTMGPINKGTMYVHRGNAYIVTANGMDKDGFWHEREYLEVAYLELEKRLQEAQRRKGDEIEALQYEIRRLRTSYPVSRIKELEAELESWHRVLDAVREVMS